MKQINQEDLQILAHLRQDARRNLTKISRNTLVPVSTIFDRIKKYSNDIIKKNTILIDFRKLGYELKVHILVKSKLEQREQLKNFLEKNQFINTLYRVNNGYDFLVEAIFKNMLQMEEFMDNMEKVGIQNKQEFYILEDIKQECFISQPELIPLIV